MLVYNCVITGDQLMSDSYKQLPVVHDGKELDGLFFVQSKKSTKSGIVLDGENPSAEAEAADSGEETVNNIVDGEIGFNYNESEKPKAGDFMKLFKMYCGAVKKGLQAKDKVPKPFMQSAKAFLPYLKANYKVMDFYLTKSMDPKSFVLGVWDDEAEAVGQPKFLYFKHALIEEKY